MSELLPCPFCGGVAGWVKVRRGHGFIVGCSECQGSVERLDKDDAISNWNRRAPLQQETDKDGERLETENKLLRKLLRLAQSGRHIHVARETDRDTCASCGQNFRSEVHFREGESKETDAALIDAAIAALPQKDSKI